MSKDFSWAASLLVFSLLAGCHRDPHDALDAEVEGRSNSAVAQQVKAEAETILAPLQPPAPGMPGGLSAVASPAIEGSIDPQSAQGAAQVVQGYYALLEEKRYPEALRQWGDNGVQGNTDPVAFARRFAGFSEIHARIGLPGETEGAAGSLYITVPVQLYARIAATGKPYYALRSVTLKRVNDVDGSTAAQRRWHIDRIGALKDTAT